MVAVGPPLRTRRQKHVIGTIEKISPESVTVKTEDGKSVDVKLPPQQRMSQKIASPQNFLMSPSASALSSHATPRART